MVVPSSQSNSSKAQHGAQNQNVLNTMLIECLDKGYISDYQKNFRIGNPDAGNDKQFYAQFMIQFANRTRWVIFSTTSMRTDRIKGQQWDALNLKELDSSITTAILAYPSNEINDLTFKRQDLKYQQNQEISAIDRILNFQELYQAIQNEFYNQIKEEIDIAGDAAALDNPEQLEAFLNAGQIWDKNGKNFEIQIAQILSSDDNLAAWKNNIAKEDNEYNFFCKMMDAFVADKNKDEVLSISATAKKDEIGYLPSGGAPKTDVIATIKFTDNSDKTITISCKRSKSNTVTVHQYTADVFADVLDKDNDVLRKLLNMFQVCGNIRDLPVGVAAALEAELQKYTSRLSLWAIGGIGGAGDPTRHWAQYIVSLQTAKNEFYVHTTAQYCDIICQKSVMFGTPFHWTYASKSKGKNIQLKAPVV